MPLTDVPGKARALYEARRTRQPIEPFTDADPDLGMADGYAVQQQLTGMLLADGDRIVGYKVGLTSKPMQQMIGVDQPDYGPVLASTVYADGDSVPLSSFIQPKIEAEIAFVLAEDLTGAMIGPAEVAAATAYVVAALEIVDSRIAGWDIGIVDTVADNGSSGLFVLGDRRQGLGALDLAECAMTLRRVASGGDGGPDGAAWAGGEVVSTGTGASILGHPLAAVAWLAAAVRDHGSPLRAGEVVLSGSLGPMVSVAPGDAFLADISGVGQVSAIFAGGTSS